MQGHKGERAHFAFFATCIWHPKPKTHAYLCSRQLLITTHGVYLNVVLFGPSVLSVL